jgi:AcrR family transcriptional regulator
MNEGPKRAPGRPRSEASREAIVDAAYWQTMERGYAAVTAESIAKTAGAGKQTLYRWWPSKAAIILDAFAQKGRLRIDRPQEAAIRAGDIQNFLRAALAAFAASGPVLRHLIAEAQSDAGLRASLQTRLIEPRRDALRRALEVRIVDAARRETLVAAIDGALWQRLLLDEPLDEAFAVQLAALAAPARG